MKSEITYNFRAYISLLPTKEGGRKSAISNGYKPNFNFGGKKLYCGELKLIDKANVQPGESAFVYISMLGAITIPKNIHLLDVFTLQEGNKVIGTGLIKELAKTETEILDLVT